MLTNTRVTLALVLVICFSCKPGERELTREPAPRPSILLVTLDTTRFDSIGPDAKGVGTPAFNALAARGLRFTQAYAPAPQTLPSHSSMLTGLYPGGHGVHENSRRLAEHHPLVSEKLQAAGYRTAAFVSAFPLARRFGLARGFEVYDDELPTGSEERSAEETTNRALAWLERSPGRPLFLWVHYFDPHYPYEPPPAFRAQYAAEPYKGEVAAMDQQMGRLLDAFASRAGQDAAIIVAADHGESLGEHGEAQHGNLLYQGVMHVPLVIAGRGVAAGVSDAPVSIRRIFHTLLDWAGLGADQSLRSGESTEVVLGEAMIPFLQFGWQPQVMAVEGRQKVIHAGAVEIYDVRTDPSETHNLAGVADLSRPVREAIRDYPIPTPGTPAGPSGSVSDEERRRLASLGYISSDVKPVVRKNAPRPRDMAHLFDDLDSASTLFSTGQYAAAIPLLERILAGDPHNLMTALRIAAAHSALGRNEQALAAFRRAEGIAPDSSDVRLYLGLHHARTGDWDRAVPLLNRVLEETPSRLPALEALATYREREQQHDEALRLYARIEALRPLTGEEQVRAGLMAMSLGQTNAALQSFERARALLGERFMHDLELGVLYLAVRRLEDARAALDRVPADHPAHAMALFKRAQVSVLLGEPDRARRIEEARLGADATTRELIANERLFRD
jgi:choline-sulfatase